jgi:hypothetical protein
VVRKIVIIIILLGCVYSTGTGTGNDFALRVATGNQPAKKHNRYKVSKVGVEKKFKDQAKPK